MNWVVAWAVFALPLHAQEPNIDAFFERFTRGFVRTDPQQASSMQIFSAEEHDRFDRELTLLTRKFKNAQMRRIRNGLAELKRFDRARFSPSGGRTAYCGQRCK